MKPNTDAPFSFDLWEGNGEMIRAHWHDNAMELLHVLSGSATLAVGAEQFDVCAGDIFFIPSGLVHHMDAHETYTTVRSLVFDVSIIEENMETIDSEIYYMFDTQSRNRFLLFREGTVYNSLLGLLDEIADEHSAKDICYKLPVRANIYWIVTILLRTYCQVRNDADRIVYQNVLRLRPVMEHISAHLPERMYIEQLADMTMVSPDYFTKMFRDSIGKTPIDYINGLRVNRALKQLCSTQKPLVEISDEIGFCNANYFHKIFKNYTGCTPVAYRKREMAKNAPAEGNAPNDRI